MARVRGAAVKLDWAPSRVAFIDYETQSECELETVHKYAAHPSTRALTCCVKYDGVMRRMGPYLSSEDKEFLADLSSSCTFVAHNAPFDAAIHELTLGLPPARWFDTLPCARAAGFPGKLDDIASILTGAGKDPNGKRLVDLLCIVRGGRVPAVGPAHKLLLDYNERDVELLEAVYHRVKEHGEPDVMTVDRTINDRGVPVDRESLRKLLALYEENADTLGQQFSDASGGVN